MAKREVEAHGLEDLAKLLRELPGRCEALKRHVVSEMAKQAQRGVVAKEPGDDDLPAYAADLRVVQVQGRDASFGVLYFGKAIPLKEHDSERTLLYVKPVDGGNTIEDFLFAVLARFQPFAVAMFPSDVPLDKAFVVARRVSVREVAVVKERNVADRPKLEAAIKKYNLRIRLDPVAIDDVETVSDTMFAVLRKELGVGVSKKPHWRPAIRLAGSSSTVKGLVASKLVQRLLSGRYRGWVKLGMLGDKVTEQEIKSIEEFQEKLLGGM